jgi:small subunit ribosomal protein S8
MAVTDPIADLLTKIRNGILAKKKIVEYSNTKMSREITRMLFENKYIQKYIIIEGGKQGLIKVLLKYY